ncbi:MAG: CBS domain-containing protein [Candidatus Bathyarchaeota archaeon]|nr:CBS domain-containing protein [Candidatus Bathyarchaeota archaeon]
MGLLRDSKKEFPSILDSAYDQYKKDLERYKLVQEIMTPKVYTIPPEESMGQAAKVMGLKHIGSLVVKKYETPVGIITERDLLTKILAQGKNPNDITVEELMSYPLVSVCINAKIKEAAQMMIKKKCRLTVQDCNKLMGIVTASDLIRSLPEIPETEALVDDFMTREVETVEHTISVGEVVKTMGDKRIGSVIITKNEKLSGIFTERDLLNAFLVNPDAMEATVGSYATSQLVTVLSGISVHKAATVMAMKQIRRLPILKDNKLVGIITARDLVEAYAK